MPVYAPSTDGGALRQAEILSELVEARLNIESLRRGDPDLLFEERNHPLAIVLTQECDLEWDYNARTAGEAAEREQLANKIVPNILLCELWNSDDLRDEQAINAEIWRRVRSNTNERYHILLPVPPALDAAGEGLPELAIDFKRVFTIPSDELYFRIAHGARRRAVLSGPYLQNLSTRFCYYYMRVALPAQGQAAQEA